MVSREALANGVITRNMGDSMGFCPPLIVERADIDFMVDTFQKSLDAVRV